MFRSLLENLQNRKQDDTQRATSTCRMGKRLFKERIPPYCPSLQLRVASRVIIRRLGWWHYEDRTGSVNPRYPWIYKWHQYSSGATISKQCSTQEACTKLEAHKRKGKRISSTRHRQYKRFSALPLSPPTPTTTPIQNMWDECFQAT